MEEVEEKEKEREIERAREGGNKLQWRKSQRGRTRQRVRGRAEVGEKGELLFLLEVSNGMAFPILQLPKWMRWRGRIRPRCPGRLRCATLIG